MNKSVFFSQLNLMRIHSFIYGNGEIWGAKVLARKRWIYRAFVQASLDLKMAAADESFYRIHTPSIVLYGRFHSNPT